MCILLSRNLKCLIKMWFLAVGVAHLLHHRHELANLPTLTLTLTLTLGVAHLLHHRHELANLRPGEAL